ncbi:3-oxoacyl-ACP synthase [Streptomyces sp. NPDC021100]|uniref:3-oxoacyl-ACP synthase n=1 Tax=Streptomyces sp. NPDC021100 TaxID=3365114 RepID=UPI00379B21A9
MESPSDVVITAAVSDDIDTAELWRAHAAGAGGRRDVNKWTGELPERIAATAGRALARAGGLPPATGCFVGSLYGSGHVAESIRARLDADARSALAPESFVYFNAHGVTSLICLRHGLRGPSVTLAGPGAGLQALAAARRRLALAGDAPALCGAYDLLSPAAARARGGAPVTGAAVFLVLETAAGARARGARVLGRLGPVEAFRWEGAGVGSGWAEEGSVADGGATSGRAPGGPTAGDRPGIDPAPDGETGRALSADDPVGGRPSTGVRAGHGPTGDGSAGGGPAAYGRVGHGRPEGAPATGVPAGAGDRTGGAQSADVRATAPLAALVAALADDGPAAAGPALTVTAAGRRHAYRCTVYREA